MATTGDGSQTPVTETPEDQDFWFKASVVLGVILSAISLYRIVVGKE